jgi:predicted nucleic acid-binding protein
VSEIWVLNASPIIVLAKIGYLDLLTELASEVLVPPAVVSEVRAGAASDPARRALEGGWGKQVPAGNTPEIVQEWSLGAGESEVLALALQTKGWTAILDDAEGRMCARALEVPVMGTLGVVLRAKRRGLLESASEVVAAMRDAGLRLDDLTVKLALNHVGEEWPA